MRPNLVIIVTAAFTTCCVTACMTTPVSGRKALNIMPESEEIAMGESAYKDVLKKEKISHDSRLNAIVTRVGKRIAAVANKPEYQWQFVVIDSEVQNAFCLPGGKIAVYRGIIPITKNEAGLATVMAHEVTHALARHGGQRITQNMELSLGMGIIQALLLRPGENDTAADQQKRQMIMAGLGAGATVGIVLPFSRGDEAEADEVGQILMARAGYDPEESIRFWDRFSEATKGQSPPAFLSDHPSSPSRAQDLRDRLPTAKTEYERAPQHYGLGDAF
ncbi:MAG: M48 family metallopeptidase [Deltaproteobacteria bacterium]|nr:M48 family metallopeptidase [Deltaproteobacteria bacterium]